MDAELVGVEGIAETDGAGTSGEKSPMGQWSERDAQSALIVFLQQLTEFWKGPVLRGVLQSNQFTQDFFPVGFDDVVSHVVLPSTGEHITSGALGEDVSLIPSRCGMTPLHPVSGLDLIPRKTFLTGDTVTPSKLCVLFPDVPREGTVDLFDQPLSGDLPHSFGPNQNASERITNRAVKKIHSPRYSITYSCSRRR